MFTLDLYKEILINILAQQEIHISFPSLQDDLNALVEMRCLTALREIRSVLDDPALDDETCFQRIEKIVAIFEKLGSDGGMRHDFG